MGEKRGEENKKGGQRELWDKEKKKGSHRGIEKRGPERRGKRKGETGREISWEGKR